LRGFAIKNYFGAEPTHFPAVQSCSRWKIRLKKTVHSANFIVWLSAPLTLEFCNIKKNNRFFTNSDSAFTKVIGFLSMIAPAAPKFGSYIQVSLRNRKIKCLLMFSDF